MEKQQSLYTKYQSINYLMNKKAQIEISAMIIFLLVTAGAVVVISNSKHIYVGDNRNKYVYDYSLCADQINKIPTQSQIIFTSKNQANSNGYIIKEGCV